MDRESGLTFTFRDGTTTKNVIDWARKFEDPEYRQVAFDEIDPSRSVSTIWQGMPSMFGPNNYETVVFRAGHIVWASRWYSEEEAAAGHAAILSKLQEGWDPEEDDD